MIRQRIITAAVDSKKQEEAVPSRFSALPNGIWCANNDLTLRTLLAQRYEDQEEHNSAVLYRFTTVSLYVEGSYQNCSELESIWKRFSNGEWMGGRTRRSAHATLTRT